VARLALLALTAASTLGCGGVQTGRVSGTVTYKNKPLPTGSVMLIASTGTILYGTIQSDGTYEIENVPLGTAKVGVTSVDEKLYREFVTRNSGKGKDDGKEKGGGAKEPGGSAKPLNYNKIPPRYGDVNQSGLRCEVQEKENTYNIDLR
jgi:hypothetical protein